MKTKNTILTAALSLIMNALALPAGYAQAVQAQAVQTQVARAADIKISYLPFVIAAPGTYVLTSDLSFPSPSGVAIDIPNTLAGPVVLDFEGHTITNPLGGTAHGTQCIGVQVGSFNAPAPNAYPITVKNGTLQGFFKGVEAINTRTLTVKSMNVAVSTDFAYTGVSLYKNIDSRVERCVFMGEPYGITDDANGYANQYLHNTFKRVGIILLLGDPRTDLVPTVNVKRFDYNTVSPLTSVK